MNPLPDFELIKVFQFRVQSFDFCHNAGVVSSDGRHAKAIKCVFRLDQIGK